MSEMIIQSPDEVVAFLKDPVRYGQLGALRRSSQVEPV